MNKKKGFTLIELLAVIVLLAILVIIAVPNVIKMLNNTKQKTFMVEAENVIKGAKNAYATNTLNGIDKTCYSLSELSDYVDKDFTGYSGSVQIDASHNTSRVWLANDKYIVAGSYSGNIEVVPLTSPITATDECEEMYVVANGEGEQVTTTITELINANEALTDRIDDLETTNTNLQSQITNLSAELTTFKNSYDTYNTYSTTEHWTGKYWTNGKKIYEKTISQTVTSIATGQSADWGISNLDEVVAFEIVGKETNSNRYRSMPIVTVGTGITGWHEFDYIYREGKIYWSNVGTVFDKFYATLQYTKTTET